jgi:hypothetical protein
MPGGGGAPASQGNKTGSTYYVQARNQKFVRGALPLVRKSWRLFLVIHHFFQLFKSFQTDRFPCFQFFIVDDRLRHWKTHLSTIEKFYSKSLVGLKPLVWLEPHSPPPSPTRWLRAWWRNSLVKNKHWSTQVFKNNIQKYVWTRYLRLVWFLTKLRYNSR